MHYDDQEKIRQIFKKHNADSNSDFFYEILGLLNIVQTYDEKIDEDGKHWYKDTKWEEWHE